MILRVLVAGALLVILGAATVDVPPEHAPAIAAGAALGLLVVTFGPRLYRRDGR